jgi:hypothetical protein
MNTFTASPDLALSIANHTIADRVQRANRRNRIRAGARSRRSPEATESTVGSKEIAFRPTLCGQSSAVADTWVASHGGRRQWATQPDDP